MIENLQNARCISSKDETSNINCISSEDSLINFTFQQLIKINQEVENERLIKLISIIKQESFFDDDCLKVLIAILMDISSKKYSEKIKELAFFHEKDVEKDERQMFVSILICEIDARKEHLLECLDEMKDTKKEVSQIIPIDLEENIIYSSKKKKKARKIKEVFILHRNDSIEKLSVIKEFKSKKKYISSKQKVVSVLEKHQSFLIYQEAFPLPKGIKRIRIKEDLQGIIKFIKNYVIETNLNVDVIIENNRAKIIFKDKKAIKKERHKIKVYLSAV